MYAREETVRRSAMPHLTAVYRLARQLAGPQKADDLIHDSALLGTKVRVRARGFREAGSIAIEDCPRPGHHWRFPGERERPTGPGASGECDRHSAVWSPGRIETSGFLTEIQGRLEDLNRNGLDVATVTYDTVRALQDFAGRRNLTFPLLSDGARQSSSCTASSIQRSTRATRSSPRVSAGADGARGRCTARLCATPSTVDTAETASGRTIASSPQLKITAATLSGRV